MGHIKPIGRKNTLIIFYLAIAGQIAWAVENSWFNTFVYDRITTDPTPVAWMVAISAIVATLTTFIMGAMSDRTNGKYGRRKPYIVIGYIFWGIMTAIYPMIEWVKVVGIAVVLVIIVDAIMTFFGSTAYDSAFNAWITDISHSSNRNRIQMFTNVSTLIANLIAIVVAGVIIDEFGYFIFFYILGGFVSLTGIITGIIMENEPVNNEINTKFTDDLRKIFDLQTIRDNKILFYLFSSMALAGISFQVYFPYTFIFMEHYIGMTKTEISLYSGFFIISLAIAMIIFGMISHKFNRKYAIIVGTIIGGVILVLTGIFSYQTHGNNKLFFSWMILYLLSQIFTNIASIVLGGWILDRYPSGDIGKFQGVRMIFMVAIPMVIGPGIGVYIIRKYGSPTVDGYIPPPELLIIAGILSILAIIPIIFIKKTEGKIKLLINNELS